LCLIVDCWLWLLIVKGISTMEIWNFMKFQMKLMIKMLVIVIVDCDCWLSLLIVRKSHTTTCSTFSMFQITIMIKLNRILDCDCWLLVVIVHFWENLHVQIINHNHNLLSNDLYLAYQQPPNIYRVALNHYQQSQWTWHSKMAQKASQK
jgi:hypothetical protein